MNKNQITGAGLKVAGKIQTAVGRSLGSETQEAKGIIKQVRGESQSTLGKAKEATLSAVRKL
jgi:uncharacterized protein YjbJ (UPF0337 family)